MCYMLNKINRLKEDRDIKDVLRYGRQLRIQSMTCYTKKTNLLVSRFAVIVSNKVSKSAVSRNLMKRRIREILRTNLTSIKTGFDCIVNIKTNITDMKYAELEKIVLSSFKTLDILNPDKL